MLGSTGLLGQAVVLEAKARGHRVTGAARKGADIRLDISDEAALAAFLRANDAGMIVNCAGLADIDACEKDPAAARRLNAQPLAALAEWSRTRDLPLIHVSTDHFFDGAGPAPHDESAPVVLVNEYAKAKHAGERLALASRRALVLRTAIVGIRGWPAPTLAEWAIDAALNDRPVTLFDDVYTSLIDVTSFARIMFDLAEKGATGLLNLGAGAVFSKGDFVREIARQLGRDLTQQAAGAPKFAARRLGALGLDVRRAEAVAGYSFPKLADVAAAVIRQYRQAGGAAR